MHFAHKVRFGRNSVIFFVQIWHNGQLKNMRETRKTAFSELLSPTTHHQYLPPFVFQLCSFLFCFDQFWSVLFSSVQFCSILLSLVQFSPVLSSSVQLCSVLFSSDQFWSVLFSSVQFCSVQFSSVLFSSVQLC